MLLDVIPSQGPTDISRRATDPDAGVAGVT